MSAPDDTTELRELIAVTLRIGYHGIAETRVVNALLYLIAAHDLEAKIACLRLAKSCVLRRTEIPKDARNPTRDATVILGEQIADIIQADIDECLAQLRKEII